MSPEATRRVLEAHFNESWRVTGPKHSTVTSEIFMGQCPRFEYPLAIKRFKADSDAHEVQFRALAELEEAWPADTGLRVPHVVACLADQRLVIMEWVRGRSLQELGTSWFGSADKALWGCRQAGMWLGRLHEVFRAEPRCIAIDAVMSSTREEVLRDLSTNRAANLALEALAVTARAAGRIEMEASRLHGDFKPENVILDDSSATAIDISFPGTNVVAFDLVQFISHLEIYAGGKGRMLSSAFLSGYSKAPPELPFLWLRLFGILKLWSATISGGKAVAHPLQWLRFNSLAKELSRELMQCGADEESHACTDSHN